jgi:hypothetical protein
VSWMCLRQPRSVLRESPRKHPQPQGGIARKKCGRASNGSTYGTSAVSVVAPVPQSSYRLGQEMHPGQRNQAAAGPACPVGT